MTETMCGRPLDRLMSAFTAPRVSQSLATPYAVLSVATEVDVNALPEGLNGRRSRMHLDLAWAQTQARNDMEAILNLQQAE